MVEIPEEKLWSWHDKKRRKKILSTSCLVILTSGADSGRICRANGLIKQLTGRILRKDPRSRNGGVLWVREEFQHRGQKLE